VTICRRIVSFHFLFPLFIVSIVLTIINTFSAQFLWPLCWPSQSASMQCSTNISWLWGYWILDAIASLYLEFNVCLQVVFAVIWIIQVPILAKPIFGVRNAFRCNILITFSWKAVNSSDSADIYYLSSSSREVHCIKCWWHRWSLWRCKCSCTMVLHIWPGSFDDLFSIWNVSHGCHLCVLSTRFILCDT